MQRVPAGYDWRVLVSRRVAGQGFAVLVTDRRGTRACGAGRERKVHGDLTGPYWTIK